MGLIDLSNVKKTFIAEKNTPLTDILANRSKRFIVFDNVTFEVQEGELLGVMGRNGAGKSTLLRCIGAIYGIDQGKIITQGDIAAIYELGSFFNIHMTGAEYAKRYLKFRGIEDQALEELLQSIHDFTELEDFFYEPVRSYSSGMKAKLLFAVATALPAKIILIDEALVVGDIYFQGKAWGRLREFLAGGSTGIIVSHDWVSLMKLCKRSIILADHRLEFLGSTYDAVQTYLRIPFKQSDVLSFLNRENMIGKPVEVISNNPFEYFFEVGIVKELPGDRFGVTFAIERYVEGIGWSLAFIGKGNIAVREGQTKTSVIIRIEDFCLAPGEYFLSIALTSPIEDRTTQPVKTIYEELSWLNSHPIKLLVSGNNPNHNLYVKRLQWTTKLES